MKLASNEQHINRLLTMCRERRQVQSKLIVFIALVV